MPDVHCSVCDGWPESWVDLTNEISTKADGIDGITEDELRWYVVSLALQDESRAQELGYPCAHAAAAGAEAIYERITA